MEACAAPIPADGDRPAAFQVHARLAAFLPVNHPPAAYPRDQLHPAFPAHHQDAMEQAASQ